MWGCEGWGRPVCQTLHVAAQAQISTLSRFHIPMTLDMLLTASETQHLIIQVLPAPLPSPSCLNLLTERRRAWSQALPEWSSTWLWMRINSSLWVMYINVCVGLVTHYKWNVTPWGEVLRYFREDDSCFVVQCTNTTPSVRLMRYLHMCNNGSSRSRCLKRVQVGDEKQLWPKLQQSSSLIYTQAMRS